MASTFVTSTKDNTGRDLVVEVRTSDGYFNATKMCTNSGKFWGQYYETQKSRNFLETLASSRGMRSQELVQSKVR